MSKVKAINIVLDYTSKHNNKKTHFLGYIIDGPLPIHVEKESVSVFSRGRPLVPALLLFPAFCLLSPPHPTPPTSPAEQGPFYTKIFHHLFTLFSPHI